MLTTANRSRVVIIYEVADAGRRGSEIRVLCVFKPFKKVGMPIMIGRVVQWEPELKACPDHGVVRRRA